MPLRDSNVGPLNVSVWQKAMLFSKAHMGTQKIWERWAALPTWWARARPQSWKIGTFWKALDIYALFFMAIFICSRVWLCQESWNQLKTFYPTKQITRESHFRGPGQKLWNLIFGSETEKSHFWQKRLSQVTHCLRSLRADKGSVRLLDNYSGRITEHWIRVREPWLLWYIVLI